MPSFQTDAQTPDKKPPFELIEDHKKSVDVINDKDSQPFEAASQSFASGIDNKEVINTDTSEKKEGFLKRRRKIITVLASFVVAAVAFGAGTLLNKDKDKHDTPNNIENNPIESNEVPSDVSNSAVITDADITIDTTEATTESNSSSSSNIEGDKAGDMVVNIVEGYNFINLSPEKQEAVKKYESMSVEDFRALPLEEQLTFADYVFDNYKPTYDLILKAQLTDDEKIHIYYTESPTTPEQIVANYSYLMTMACNLIEANDGGNGWHKDLTTGKKLVSLISTITDEHKKSSDSIIDGVSSTDIVIIDISAIDGESKTNSDGSITINTNWNSTEGITVLPEAVFSQKTFTNQSFVNKISGEQHIIYLRDLAVGLSDPQYINLG